MNIVSTLRWLTTVLSNNKFLCTRVSRKQLRARKQRSVQVVCNAHTRAHTQVNLFFRSAHAQVGRMKCFSFVNFSKSGCTTYAQFLIFLNILQHLSSDNFSSKSVRQILIFKKLSYRFLF